MQGIELLKAFKAPVFAGSGTVSIDGWLTRNGATYLRYVRTDGELGEGAAVLFLKRGDDQRPILPDVEIEVEDGDDIVFGDDFTRRICLKRRDMDPLGP